MARSEAQKRADKKYDQTRAGKRTRNWAGLVYPESAVEGWLQRLSEKCIPCFVSPLHDQDVWSDYDESDNIEHIAGEPKKAHYHIQFMFNSVKTADQVQEILKEIGGTNCIALEDASAYARYLCHLGSKDKHVYSIDDVQQFGGADYYSLIEGVSDKIKAIAEMEEWCEEQGVTSYRVLSKYCRQERHDWYRVLCFNGRHIKDVLKAAEWESKVRYEAEHLGRCATSNQEK